MATSVNDENGGAMQNAAAEVLPMKKRRIMTGLKNVKTDVMKNEFHNAENLVGLGNSDAPPAPPGAGYEQAENVTELLANLPVVDGPKKRRPGRRWTQQEDIVLRKLVEKNGNRHWKRIAKEFFELSGSERSDVQCLHRWNKCLKPGLVKGPWSPEEDEKILQMIKESGGPQNVRWSVIAKSLDGRLGKQVRERFINHLDPTISKDEWTPEEDQQLYELNLRLGNRWKWIAELMPGRSENGVKNRWHSIKPQFLARNGGDAKDGQAALPPSKKDAAALAMAGKTAAAAAVAAAVASSKKAAKRSASGRASGPANRKKRASPSSLQSSAVAPAAKRRSPRHSSSSSSGGTGGSSPSGTATLADLLSIGQSLATSGRSRNARMASSSSPSGGDFTAMDVNAVAERAKELLRMSESYREMAKLMLAQQQAKPSSPHFNDLLQREIANQIAKQLGGSGSGSFSGVANPSGVPTVLTGLQGPGNSNSSSPISTDPVLFSNYFNVFSTSMEKAGAVGKPVSPHQLLAAAAAAAQVASGTGSGSTAA